MATDYHAEIGWPDVDFVTGKIRLSPTSHAKRESNRDQYGDFELPECITLKEEMYQRDPREAVGEETKPHVFEITVHNDRIEKLGFRSGYDSKRDIILIIKPWDNLIKTAWTNLKDDPHETLNREKYSVPE